MGVISDALATFVIVSPTGDTSSQPTKHADSGRLGKAVEHLVAASCIIASRARLNVSTSLVDDEGVDLVFHRRGGTATLAVQVKARMSDSKRVKSGGFVAFVRRQTFKARADLYMLFVPVDIPNGSFEQVWFVPSTKFEAGASSSMGRLRFAASLKPQSKDKWAGYKVARADLHKRILTTLTALDRTGA